VVVVLLHRELDLGPRVGVSKTEDRAVDISGLKLLDQLLAVLTQTPKEIRHNFASFAGFTRQTRESRLDASSQVLLTHAESDCLLLAGLGQVCL
jgi:hypothetical protein